MNKVYVRGAIVNYTYAISLLFWGTQAAEIALTVTKPSGQKASLQKKDLHLNSLIPPPETSSEVGTMMLSMQHSTQSSRPIKSSPATTTTPVSTIRIQHMRLIIIDIAEANKIDCPDTSLGSYLHSGALGLV